MTLPKGRNLATLVVSALVVVMIFYIFSMPPEKLLPGARIDDDYRTGYKLTCLAMMAVAVGNGALVDRDTFLLKWVVWVFFGYIPILIGVYAVFFR